MGPSNGLCSESGDSPTTTSPTGFYCLRFEALFLCTGTLGCTVCLPLQFFLVYLQANAGLPRLPAAALPHVLSAPAARARPSYSQDKCFFFNPLVVGLPYSLIFWQFWLFVVFFLIGCCPPFGCARKQSISYLCLHLGRKS